MPIGTRVRLASGGPEMLVVDLDTERMQVLCAWGPRSEMWLPVACVDVIRRFDVAEAEMGRLRDRLGRLENGEAPPRT